MTTRKEVDLFLSKLFALDRYPDRSLNGLQVEGADEISGFCLGVDACLDLFEQATARGLNYIIVHHGFFWGQPFPIKNIWVRRFKLLMEHGLSLFAIHLPMDIHPELGHNIVIAQELGLVDIRPFGHYKGMMLGYEGEFLDSVLKEGLYRRLTALFVNRPVTFPFGPVAIKRVGIIAGDAASQEILEEAKDRSLDILITGEVRHVAYHPARELLMDVAFCGHYETEKWSLLRLQDMLSQRFGLPAEFIYLPTGC